MSKSNFDSDLASAYASMSVDQLVDQQSNLQRRLASLVVSVPPLPVPPNKRRRVIKDENKPSTGAVSAGSENDADPSSSAHHQAVPVSDNDPPIYPKLHDTHHDYMLKEMQWLAADFAAERRRHLTARRKLAAAVASFAKSKESRWVRELADAELKRRRLAARISRLVKVVTTSSTTGAVSASSWWGKIDRVVAYQQKISLEQERAKAMNKQLVQLVKLTEQYTHQALNLNAAVSQDDDYDEEEENRRRPRPLRTIEEALALGETSSYSNKRRSLTDAVDYTRIQHSLDEGDVLYGENTTASEHESDSSYLADSDGSVDDETTLLQAEREEQRLLSGVDDDSDIESGGEPSSFQGDPVELRKLQEEAEMPINQVLDRLKSEATETSSSSELPAPTTKRKTVTFHDAVSHSLTNRNLRRLDPGNDADDDGDASDVDDFVMEAEEADSDADGSGEFVADDTEMDDETTMAQEEALPKEMSAQEEIELLKQESNMSVERLREQYAAAFEQDTSASDDVSESDGGNYDSMQGILTTSLLAPSMDDADEQDEFQPDCDEVDDETTMEAEEKQGRDMSYDDELALLQREGELSIDELRALYSNQDVAGNVSVESSEDHGEQDGSDGVLKSLEDTSKLAQETLATRPYLLAPWVKLREYQQVGLNWLVSLQSRRLNGILADEMGLGKTLQTIALFAYLAAYKGIWGPHLVVVPTSVLLNWETELKRFCPGLKVLCYFGSAKRRKELRQGWTKTNWFHVVLTSYQLVVQDAFAFKRKKWYYMVLDEAHNIKNFQSQRWQTLIHFNTQRRLLLTGTPLQNNLMELWSLLHFLMPHVFRSRKEFSFWFANPMSGIAEGTKSHNDNVVNRLHGIIRPFVLRRLKKDVESQMPGKFEHIVRCQLSRRQMFIYEEYMARSSTRQSLKGGGNFLAMMNVLMQLRKVCNHPDLFEPRPVITPFVMQPFCLPIHPDTLNLLEPIKGTTVGQELLVPLWSGSCGLPSTYGALRHDDVESEELRVLHESSFELACAIPSANGSIPPSAVVSQELKQLWSELTAQKLEDEADHLTFLAHLNVTRCHKSPFPFSLRLLRAVDHKQADHFMMTPASLLALRRSQHERSRDMNEYVKNFTFCVPKASARNPVLRSNSGPSDFVKRKAVGEMLLEPLEQLLTPFRAAEARLSSFFPDKNLIQFDSGKLQVLAELLRELKMGGHRVLIFTQMSKMLDILEAFLNIHGYTYMRLDGSTGVDRRQRLMDRFNSDDKVFCFILSTRSGGLGINLVGADTVIFYDSDWNPSMDAQAQDRAHRIGQTREVHIYRLVTEHTIEENILLKAQQKRNLDILVMDKGRFDASQLQGHGESARAVTEPADTGKLYTTEGLRDILGAGLVDNQSSECEPAPHKVDTGMSAEEMEKAMISLEDVDDVAALHGAQKEATEDLREFDESIEIKNLAGSDDEDDELTTPAPGGSTTKIVVQASSVAEEPKTSEDDLEKEFGAWQEKVGVDSAAITASLGPAERYGLRFRQDIDPYYSMFAVTEYNMKVDAANEVVDELDIAAIERAKALEERQAMENGDLLATFPKPDDLIRQRALYQREKRRLRANKKRRKLTGEAWEERKDGVSDLPFWYNIDTGEARWEKPTVLEELEAFDLATEKGFGALPMRSLLAIMEYLSPYPDRMSCALACRQWRKAASSPSFVKHVYPVELGAYTRDAAKVERNHFRSINEALSSALPGDTIELGDGHYWINEDHVYVHAPVRIVGDEHEPSNVLVEVNGTIHWHASRGHCEGVTFRRPRMSSVGENNPARDLIRLEHKAKLNVVSSVFDNEGSSGHVVCATGRGMKGVWRDVIIKCGSVGLSLNEGAGFGLLSSAIKKQTSFGILCTGKSKVVLTGCKIQHIGEVAVKATHASQVKLTNCTTKDIGGQISLAETEATVTFA